MARYAWVVAWIGGACCLSRESKFWEELNLVIVVLEKYGFGTQKKMHLTALHIAADLLVYDLAQTTLKADGSARTMLLPMYMSNLIDLWRATPDTLQVHDQWTGAIALFCFMLAAMHQQVNPVSPRHANAWRARSFFFLGLGLIVHEAVDALVQVLVPPLTKSIASASQRTVIHLILGGMGAGLVLVLGVCQVVLRKQVVMPLGFWIKIALVSIVLSAGTETSVRGYFYFISRCIVFDCTTGTGGGRRRDGSSRIGSGCD